MAEDRTGVVARLDVLEAAHKGATPGKWREVIAEAVRDVLDTCTCTPYPAGDGPEIDCPMHGRADFQGQAVADALLTVLAARDDRLRQRVTALADVLDDEARTCSEEAARFVDDGLYRDLRGRALAKHDAADRLRALVAAALGEA